MCQCDEVFVDFRWKDITTVVPSRDLSSIGVYAIRVKQMGIPVDEITNRAFRLLDEIGWDFLTKRVQNRLNRLNRIANCPIIYIGAAPTSFRSRFQDFRGRHVAMYPTWALLWGGWKLEYGWLQNDLPEETERLVKGNYFRVHNCLPALVER